jgi:phosphoenolpyruvate synthase/pyruvate phosphate dikinase
MLSFKANKISGIPGTNFALSVIPHMVDMQEGRIKFHFPFYAISLDIEKDKADEWIRQKDYEEVTNSIIEYIRGNGISYFEELKKQVREEAEDLKSKSVDIQKRMNKLKDDELIKEYDKFISTYCSYYIIGAIAFIYEHIISERLSNSLSRYKNSTEIIESLLKTNYKSFMIESEEQLLKIKNNPDNKNLVDNYLKEFFFMKVNYEEAPVITEKTIKEDASKANHTPNNKISNLKYNLNEEERIMVDLLKITEVIRDQRKKTNLIGTYTLFRFLDEAIKRKNIEINLAKRIFFFEFKDLMINPKIRDKLQKRKSTSYIYDGKKVHYLEYSALEEEIKLDKNQSSIKGVSASRGTAKGKVKIILGTKDFQKLNSKDILVTEMTRPDFLPIMKKASAIITDEGSLTCHAAIVARELGIPCIVGTKTATRLLKDGDEVEVDANKGNIKILKKS